MPTPTAAHKNLIMASLVHLSFQSACHGLFLVVFVLFIVAASILTAVALACDLPVRLSGAAPVLQLRKFPHA